MASCAPQRGPLVSPGGRPLVLGLHAIVENADAADTLAAEIPGLARRGVTLLITEVNYNYAYVSHPELRGEDPVSREAVKRLVALCRDHGIRLVPQFQSLGHQSWKEKTFPLLIRYPHLDESPGKYPGNTGKDPWGTDFYCRSWCPLHPEVMPIITDLYDELIDIFEADSLHIGMDEVFIIADEDCPRCAGKDPAELP